MTYNSLSSFIKALEKEGELIRVEENVTPELEISEITDRIVKSNNNKALLFENNGTEFPLLINAFGSERRMSLALGVESLDEIANDIETLFKKITKPQPNLFDKLRLLSELKDVSSWMPKKLKERGLCQEIVMQEPDLTKLPVLKCWPYDGGPFITLPVVHTIHPDTQQPNAGMYRMQVFDKQTTGMHWHLHKDSAKHYHAYKEKGSRMPVSVTLGGDPVYTYAASAPLPPNVDEYILAGFLRKKKVALVKSLTNDIYVPADADFVIEGYVDTSEALRIEGPFGDHTGFYSLADWYPVFHVSCITHRKNAIYPTTIVGIPPQEDAWLGKATERIFLAPIRLTMLPELLDMNMPLEGVFHNIVLVKSQKHYEGHPFKIMNALWGAGQMMFNKILVVMDESVNINNYSEVFKVICKNVNPATDILISKGPLDVLDHSADITGFGGKIGIDTTYKHKPDEIHESVISSLTEAIIALKEKYSFIVDFNKNLIIEGYNTLVLSVEKKNKTEIREVTAELLNNNIFKSIKFVVFIESLINPYDLMSVVWRSANNIEPSRDCSLAVNVSGKTVLVADATMKNKKYDNFNKDWPNILTSDAATIALVDQKWNKYGLGVFVESPSLKFTSQIYNEGESVKSDRW